ncbi:protein kinase domain-containing protein [Streptomyces somaliensis]|uniref:non-specific serine/threonine protein kinase n=1 Tax=Streptomyces somaliensis (strain ATCC 33201 / DSM 40738 / JCM 12659 / KCTC 9044 / NCTC 11332 / NRRL B-12077 / IP 733) TaxID=1134445 RepID=A0AA44IC02_STRE0|nr:protein kinase [Streptomyces somaliensis]NKY12892.1 serine/threonine protein kinase [Streptomyces somaliensis DSM 40738]
MAPGSEAGGGGVSDDGAPGRGDAVEFGAGGLVGDGRYRLTHRLGRGGMAEVFAAEDVRLGRTVAVKLLRTDLAEDPVSKARFTREAQSVAGLNHHAIVAVYDSGEDEVNGQAVPYIVMELVEGRTIRELLVSAEAPPPEQALIIVSGVLEALAYSHQHGIVHRDIKPANVIITGSGAVKVMDFGIARALHGASTTMTQTGMVMGTPQYLSPEQALGKAVDHRSDLYATGCLLYELLALRPPFVGETPLSVVYQHVQDTPVPPSRVSDAAPPELDGLAMRALAKDPDDRFQSAEEMRGLIQYGLRMLQEQGGHTGTWNTGALDPYEGGHTPHGGVAATAVMGAAGGPSTPSRPVPLHGDTSQAPILPPVNPDDGAHTGGYDRGHGGGGGRGRVLLFVAFALIAIVAGIVYAVNASETPAGTDVKPSNSPTPSVSGSTTPSPSASESEEETGRPDTSTGGSGGWTPPTRPPAPPSYSQDPTPSTSGDTGGTGTTDGSGDGGATDGGTDGGTTDGSGDGGTTGSTDTGGGTTDGSGDGGTTGSTDTGGGDATGTTGSGQQGGTTAGTASGGNGFTTGG